MPLKEIRNGAENVYADDEKVSQSEWVRLLGVSLPSFQRALRRVNVELEVDPHASNGNSS